MSSADRSQQRLIVAVENAARDLGLVAAELRVVADSLGWRQRNQARELESVAIRLDSLAGALGQEIMLGGDGLTLRLLCAVARRVLALGLAAIAFVAGGVLEGVGSEAYEGIRAREGAATTALDHLCDLTEDIPDDQPHDVGAEEEMPDPVSEDGFSGKQAAEIVGITYRQLDYWARTDLVRPSLTEGAGSRRRYASSDLLHLAIIKAALDNGLKLESVRDVMAAVEQNPQPTAYLWLSGSGASAVPNDEALASRLSHADDEVATVISIREVSQRLSSRVSKLRSGSERDDPPGSG